MLKQLLKSSQTQVQSDKPQEFYELPTPTRHQSEVVSGQAAETIDAKLTIIDKIKELKNPAQKNDIQTMIKLRLLNNLICSFPPVYFDEGKQIIDDSRDKKSRGGVEILFGQENKSNSSSDFLSQQQALLEEELQFEMGEEQKEVNPLFNGIKQQIIDAVKEKEVLQEIDIKENPYKSKAFSQKLSTLGDELKNVVEVLVKPPYDRTPDELRMLYQAFRLMPAFSSMDVTEQDLTKLFQQMGCSFENKGKTLFEINQPGEYFYVVLRGEVLCKEPHQERAQVSAKLQKEIALRDKIHEQIETFSSNKLASERVVLKQSYLMSCATIDTLTRMLKELPQFTESEPLRQGDPIGLRNVVEKRPRGSTCIAKTETVCAVIGRIGYMKLLKREREKQLKQLVDIMRDFDWFREWATKEQFAFTNFLKPVSFSDPGTTIFQEGKPSDNIGILVAGEFQVSRLNFSNINVNVDRRTIKINTVRGKPVFSENSGAPRQSSQKPIGDPAAYMGTDLQVKIKNYVENAKQNKTTAESFLIQSNTLKVSEMKFATLGPGMIFGLSDAAVQRPYNYTLKTKTRGCQIYMISRKDFVEAGRNLTGTTFRHFLSQTQTALANKLANAIFGRKGACSIYQPTAETARQDQNLIKITAQDEEKHKQVLKKCGEVCSIAAKTSIKSVLIRNTQEEMAKVQKREADKPVNTLQALYNQRNSVSVNDIKPKSILEPSHAFKDSRLSQRAHTRLPHSTVLTQSQEQQAFTETSAMTSLVVGGSESINFNPQRNFGTQGERTTHENSDYLPAGYLSKFQQRMALKSKGMSSTPTPQKSFTPIMNKSQIVTATNSTFLSTTLPQPHKLPTKQVSAHEQQTSSFMVNRRSQQQRSLISVACTKPMSVLSHRKTQNFSRFQTSLKGSPCRSPSPFLH